MNGIRIKTVAAPPPGDDPLEFIMSDGSVDRMGDVIEPDGWLLDNFRKNPIALFGHDSRFPIGRWLDVGVRDGELRGRLDLLTPVSDRMRELHAAVSGGVLRAVSVGFHPSAPDKIEPLEGSQIGGLHFLEQELVECSLVTVPANPNALAVAKALGISAEGQRLIFGVSADDDRARQSRGSIGVPAGNLIRKHQPMNQLSERIQAAQIEVNTMRDELGGLIAADDFTKSNELTERIEAALAKIAAMERAERALGNSTEQPIVVPASRTTVIPPGGNQRTDRPVWAQPQPQREVEPGYLFIRHCVVTALAHITKKPVDAILAERYGHYADFATTREIHEWFTRAASAPATLTTTGWAAELAAIQYGEFFDALMPASIFRPLSAKGFRASLGRFAQLSMPTRSSTPAVAGSFVGEGAPIPVRQAAFTPVTIGLKKMAIICSYTRELAEHSTPQIEQLLRQLITEDTEVAVDTILIDANPATAIRPAGLRNGVAGLTPTAGGGFAALVADVKQLIAVLSAANALRVPVWIMNPQQAVSISLTMNAGGFFPFKAEIDSGMLQGYPVIESNTVPLGTVILMNADDFMSVTGDDPRFDVSDQATLHFEDTTPLQIGTPGTPPTVAAPVRNLFQTDSLALRMVLPMNWAMRRTGVVAWIAAVTW